MAIPFYPFFCSPLIPYSASLSQRFHLLLFHYPLANKKRGMKDPTVYALPAQIASPSGQGGLSYSTYQKQLRLTRSITITKRIYQVERPLLFLLDLSQPVDWDRLGLYCNVSWEHFSSSGKSGSPVFNYRKYLASQICLGSAKEELYSGFSLVSRCSSKST